MSEIFKKIKFKSKLYFVHSKFLVFTKTKIFIESVIKLIKKYSFFLISSFVIFCFLYWDISIKSYDFSNILIALASIIATILALVFTLSLIPIQNAASMWSFTILRIYKEDKERQKIFAVFGMSILAFILLAIFQEHICKNIIFIFLSLSIGVVLDSLKYYYTHIVSLMDPQSILEKIKAQAFKTIDGLDSTAKLVAKNQYFLQEKKENLYKLEAEAYKINPNYPQVIKYWFNDLAEIYQKSVARNDLIVAKATLSYMVSILDYFVEKRESNISYHLVPTGFLPLKEADITKDVIIPLCEILKDMFDISCKNSTENMALEIISTYKDIAVNLSKKDINLSLSPTHYVKDCIKNAQLRDSIEIPFQASQIMYEMYRVIEDENAFLILDENLIDLFEDVARYLYTQNHPEAAETVVKYLMYLNEFDENFKNRFQRVLEVIERLIPYAMILEIKNTQGFYNPLREVYSFTCGYSIGNIYQQAIVQRDIGLVVDLLKVTYRHLRVIAERYDIQNSFMIHEINCIIEHIADINLSLLNVDRTDEKKLNDKIKWLLSFYWAVYDKKEVFKEPHLRRCIKTLKKIALSYMQNGFDDVASNVLSHVKAILENISRISKTEYLIQDIKKEYDDISAVVNVQKDKNATN